MHLNIVNWNNYFSKLDEFFANILILLIFFLDCTNFYHGVLMFLILVGRIGSFWVMLVCLITGSFFL